MSKLFLTRYHAQGYTWLPGIRSIKGLIQNHIHVLDAHRIVLVPKSCSIIVAYFSKQSHSKLCSVFEPKLFDRGTIPLVGV
jgi:hypothetical protein